MAMVYGGTGDNIKMRRRYFKGSGESIRVIHYIIIILLRKTPLGFVL